MTACDFVVQLLQELAKEKDLQKRKEIRVVVADEHGVLRPAEISALEIVRVSSGPLVGHENAIRIIPEN